MDTIQNVVKGVIVTTKALGQKPGGLLLYSTSATQADGTLLPIKGTWLIAFNPSSVEPTDQHAAVAMMHQQALAEIQKGARHAR